MNKKSGIFEFLFAISFILNGYATGIPGISMGSFVFLLMILWATISNKLKYFRNANIVYLFYLCWIVVSLIGMSQVDETYISLSSVFVGNSKMLTWVLMITIVMAQYYNFEKLVKWMTRIAVILTIYIIVQTVAFYIFSVYLPNIFSFGPIQPYAEGYADYERLGQGEMLRPASLLSESSFYGNFVLCTLAMYLERYFKNLSLKNWFVALFLSLGAIVSTSTSAIVLLGLVWVVYLYRLKVNKALLAVIGVAIIAVFVVIQGLIRFESISGLVNALEYAFDKFDYLDTSARVGQSYGYIAKLNSAQKLFGVGIGNDVNFLANITNTKEIYVNAITSLIVQMGYIGLGLFMIFILVLYMRILKRKDSLAFVLLCIYFIKGFVSGIYFSTYGILFMFVIMGQLYSKKGRENAREKYYS